MTLEEWLHANDLFWPAWIVGTALLCWYGWFLGRVAAGDTPRWFRALWTPMRDAVEALSLLVARWGRHLGRRLLRTGDQL